MPVYTPPFGVAPRVVQPRPQCVVNDVAFLKGDTSVRRHVDMAPGNIELDCAIGWLAKTTDACRHGQPCIVGEILHARRGYHIPDSDRAT